MKIIIRWLVLGMTVVANMGHILILSNVRHVTELRLNLMLPGKLDDTGFT